MTMSEIKTQDLDATIARMRGWPEPKHMDFNDEGRGWLHSHDLAKLQPFKPERPLSHVSLPYSPATDARDTMELLEEMLGGMESNGQMGVKMAWIQNPDQLGFLCCERREAEVPLCDTLPEAICRAWIAWREAQTP